MKSFKLFNTDYYQLSMVLAYILNDKANEQTAFEAFYRRSKNNLSNGFAYIFSGEVEVRELMQTYQDEVQDPEFLETFLGLIMKMVPENRRSDVETEIRERWDNLEKTFEYDVYPEGTVLHPYVPAFQYYGPKWIGQLMETPICNTINGKTGLKTIGHYGTVSDKDFKALKCLVYETQDDFIVWNGFLSEIYHRAIEFSEANEDGKILLEAGLRRAPSILAANVASDIALDNGWHGTSNVAAHFTSFDVPLDKIGGTMAHAFVMSFSSELEAYKAWDKVFPNSTILIDTYDVIGAIKMLIEHDIKPSDVRIDSEPLDDYAIEVRQIMDDAGWNDVGIFISGDLTPQRIRNFNQRNIPYDKWMAGTKYVNVNLGSMVNAGFVYKVVQFEENGQSHYPEKASTGKSNYSGLKRVYVLNGDVVVDCRPDNGQWGLNFDPADINSSANVNILDYESKWVEQV